MPDFPLDPIDLAAAIDMPLDDWPGNCHAVATLVLEMLPVPGMRLVRGHFHGSISKKSIYSGPFCQHSWLELVDGRILDPTRWAIERPLTPTIYLGVNDAYDEAGIQLAQSIGPVLMSARSGSETMLEKCSAADLRRVACALGLLPEKIETSSISRSLEFALKSDPSTVDDAPMLYDVLQEIGLKCLIKIDLWNAVMEREQFTCRPGANRLFTLPASEDRSDEALLLKILAHFISIEERDCDLERELEDLGYTLDEWHEALNNYEHMAVKGDFMIEEMPRSWVEPLATVSAELLGQGFGVVTKVERFAKSLGLSRKALDALLRKLGDRAGYDVGWI